MKKSIIFSLLMGLALASFSQRYLTKTGHIYFHSKAPMETIEAHNHQVNAALDAKTGSFVFKVLMKSFVFEKALMQEHFNENYVESDKFPNALFKGKVLNIKDVDFDTPGDYPVDVEGTLTIHGKTNTVKTKGTFTVQPDKSVEGKSSFTIKIADYNISIPDIVAGKIAEEPVIYVDVKLKPYKK